MLYEGGFMINVQKYNFILLTTSQAGVNLAKGLQRAGHQLVAIGRGYSSDSEPVGAITSLSLSSQFSSDIPISNLSLDISSDITDFISSYKSCLVLISWPKIIPARVLSVSNSCFIGTHPTPLPLGRGRHPLHWMRVLGIKRSQITAFFLDPGVDTGLVISSIPYSLNPRHCIKQDLALIERKYFILGFIIGIKLWFGIPKGRHQGSKFVTVWRKRNQLDTKIDFRMSPEAIIQHVKSFSSPFSLASCELNGTVFKLASAHRAIFALSAKKNRWSIFGSILKEYTDKKGGQ